MKKSLLLLFLFILITLFALSWYFLDWITILFRIRYGIIQLFGIRDYFRFINIFIDNFSVMCGGGLGYLLANNAGLIALYSLIAIVYTYFLKRSGAKLDRKKIIFTNGIFISFFIGYIILTVRWPLINIFLIFLLLFIHHLVWTPRLFIKKDNTKIDIYKFVIFLCLSTLLIILTGNNAEKAVLFRGCGYYDLKISPDLNKVFFLQYNTNEPALCQNEVETIEVMNLESENLETSEIPYKSRLGHYISVDENRGNLYLTDRASEKLVIMDINDYTIKGEVYHPMIDEGDNYIEYDRDSLYLLGEGENELKLIKVDLNTMKIVKTNVIEIDAEGIYMALDHKGMLYLTNMNHKERVYYIWVVDPSTLKIVKKVQVSGPILRVIFLKKKDELYHTVPMRPLFGSSVSIRDAESFKVKDTIIVPFGLRDIAIDKERELLFAGNVFTGIIEVIDLNTKNIIKLIKTSDYMLRKMELDTKNKNLYVTTWAGIYRYHYN